MNNFNNVFKYNSLIGENDRRELNGHRSAVVWFTGLSGSGKSTLAHAVEKELFRLGCRAFVLDGDNIRSGLSSDLGFSDKDRKENIRRIGEVSKLMMKAGIVTLSALISPFLADREMVRDLFSDGEFFEVYCKASLEVCEGRDTKGLYKRVRSGEISNYTGIDSPYEPPKNPSLVIDSENESLEESVVKVIELLKKNRVIS